jgi:glycosyltransferase involved in cell wall biosynthesis
MVRKLRVAIDCRIDNPQQGIGTALLALAKALSDSGNEKQEYTFIVRESVRDWLSPYIYGSCKLACIPQPMVSAVKASLRRIPPVRFIKKKLRDNLPSKLPPIPVSDGHVESQKFDVVHFPAQTAYLTDLPTIYQPHDLQHLHYPQFFPENEVTQREREFRAFFQQAAYICVQTEWTRQDLIRHYDVAAEKVVVVPWGSVFEAYKPPSTEEIRAAVDKYALPPDFFFYPAVTWPHKNHEVIFRAIQLLKHKLGVDAQLVLTGNPTNFRATLDRLARELGISAQVHYLGFLPPAELQAIFSAAVAMIYPSKFEGFGLPILEAFQARLPVLSSSATTLPEVARDGALFFDPDSPGELSALMMAVLQKRELREDLIGKGLHVLSQYSFANTAASFQKLYSRTAALPAADVRLACSSLSN